MDFRALGIALENIEESQENPGWYSAPIARDCLKKAYEALQEAGYTVDVGKVGQQWMIWWMTPASELMKSGVINGIDPSEAYLKVRSA